MFLRAPLPLLASSLVLLIAASACAMPAAASLPTPTAPVVAQTVQGYMDPFAYCAAVKTIDAPDTRYMGPAVPDSVLNGFKMAAGLQASSEPTDTFRHSTIWRCMQGRVYACNYGANLPCDAKADTNKDPTPAMLDFCNNNPDSDVIPMAVVGHATIYDWRCKGRAAEIRSQIDLPDPRGYLSRIWYPLPASP